ncbi:aminotransferase-like domain-containing protein [Sphingobacterium sp. SYP-B4668]|uniref:aminotransferase-like domain-containing protein n=1 Tax=Sphingobacterium sp. SYP-B4668 TaxID=2996035 RepID=UPI0022DDDC83|nr:PLP-dependent aminotransferase family protein [Sphingobacterium sp. SYP-B4668]
MNNPIIVTVFEGISLQPGTGRALYLQLADQILALLTSNTLVAGQKLLSTRDAGALLGINRLTVQKAYEELEVQGWLVSGVGKGTFVSNHVADHQPKQLGSSAPVNRQKIAGFSLPSTPYATHVPLSIPELHFDDGYPDPRLSPLKELYRAYRNQLSRSGLYDKYGSYADPTGADYYLETISHYLNTTRGLKSKKQNILSTRGTLMGIHLVIHALVKPGDVVLTGVPGWGRVEGNILYAGATHIPIGIDEHGIRVDEIAAICQTQKIRMVYVTPHHHYPTTVSLRIDRRLELLRLANVHGFIILEDDYDYDFHYKQRPILPLASQDENGMVIYCGSFSKSLSPAFRIGYIAAAENVIRHLANIRILHDRQGDHIMDNAIADIINDGTVQRYLRRTLPIYQRRRDLFCTCLQSELSGNVQFGIPEGGMSVWVHFAPDIDLSQLVKRAYQKGLLLSDGDVIQDAPFHENGLRLGFASSTEAEIIQGISILKSLLSSSK